MGRMVLTLSCDDRPGVVSVVTQRLFAGRRQYRRGPAIQRRVERSLLHAHRVRRRTATRRRGVQASTPSRATMASTGASAHCAQPRKVMLMVSQVRPLPRRPAVPLSARRTADGGRRDRRQPPARGADHLADRRHSLPPPARHAATKPQQEATDPADRRGQRRRTGRARPLHADPVGRIRLVAQSAAASTSTTASCPASRAPSPITRPTSAG